MGWLTDSLKAIPVSALLGEWLALAEQKFKDIQSENAKLKEQVAALTVENESLKHIQSENAKLKEQVVDLTAENESLKRMARQAPVAVAQAKDAPELIYGCYFFGRDPTKLYCPVCYENKGQKHIVKYVRHLGRKCTVCGHVIPS